MDQHLYKVVQIENKGQGCIALKDIKKGTLILQEKPQIVAKSHGINPDGSKTVNILEIIKAFGQMSEMEKDGYFKLHNRHCQSKKNFVETFHLEGSKNLDICRLIILSFSPVPLSNLTSIDF